MPSTRTFAILCGGSFAALLIVGWGGNILEGSGLIRDPAPFRYPLLGLMIGFLFVFAFSAIPLMVGAVLGFQRQIGNENVPMVRSALSARNIVVYTIWGLMAAGTAVAIPAAILNGALGTIAPDSAQNESPPPSQGLFVAAPGITFAEMARRSTLKLDIATRAPITSAIGGGGVFDFHIPDTALTLRNCRYYFISPYTHDASRIEAINVGLSPHTISRSELEQADAELRGKLAADGWLTGHEEYRTAEDRALHGGAARGRDGGIWLKNGMVLSLGSRRMDEAVPGEDTQRAGKWIQFIDLWRREDYPYIGRYTFAPPR